MMNNVNMVTEITNDILCNMQDCLNEEQYSKLKKVLAISLHDLNITKECRELALNVSDENERLLKLFKADCIVRNLAEGTIYQYVSNTYKMLQFLNKYCLQVTKQDIIYYFANIKTRNYNDSTIDNFRRWISAFYSWLVENDYLAKSPFNSIKPHKASQVKKVIPTDFELESLRDVAIKNSKRELALFDFLYSTGVRVSEVTELKLQSIDFNNNMVLIYAPKTKKYRNIPLSTRAIKHIKEYHDELHSKGIYSEYVFVNERKTKNSGFNHTSKSSITKMLKKLTKDANVTKNITVHSFRKSLATRLKNAGIDIGVISYILGHSNFNTTYKHYIEMQPDMIKRELQKFSF